MAAESQVKQELRMSLRRWIVGGLSVVVVAGCVYWGLVELRALANRMVTPVIDRSVARCGEVAAARCREAAAVNQDTDIPRAMQRKATAETAAFVEENMLTARAFPDKWALLAYSVKAADAKLGGLYCEFGVGSGESISFISKQTAGPVHGFDSFEGLPENWRDGYGKGAFATAGLPQVGGNVLLHKGWFKDSLPRFRKEFPQPMAFMHMDADLYSSTRDVLEIVGDRIVAGTVMQFDEYFNYPGWRQHEFRAFQEFVKRRGVRFEYLGYVGTNQQVAVRIVRIGAVRPRGN